MEKRTLADYRFLEDFLKSVSSYTEDLIYGSSGQTVYHYTNLDGLRGIIKEDDLWLTHSRYSNDEEEITHGYKIVNEVIEEIKNDTKSKIDVAFLNRLVENVKDPESAGVYICCFCLKDNLLSQWRSYGANGNGVCIGINPNSFDYITGPDSPHGGLMRLWKVFYNFDTQKSIINSAINFAFNVPEKSIEERALLADYAIQFFIPTFKNEGFEEEKECRLIFTPTPNFVDYPDYRIARNLLVPYYSLKKLGGTSNSSRKLPITEITIGPSNNKQLIAKSTEMMLVNKGYTTVKVKISATPYRG